MNPTFSTKEKPQHSVQTLAVIVLLFLFAFSALMLIAMGASVYTKNVNDLAALSKKRTAYAYLTQKLRQNDAAGKLRIDHFPMSKEQQAAQTSKEAPLPDALIIQETLQGNLYETYLYAYDGSLRELTIRQGTEVTPEMGAEIFPAQNLRIIKDETHAGLYRLQLTTVIGAAENSEDSAADTVTDTQELLLQLRSDHRN